MRLHGLLPFATTTVRGWDLEFESGLLQRRVINEPGHRRSRRCCGRGGMLHCLAHNRVFHVVPTALPSQPTSRRGLGEQFGEPVPFRWQGWCRRPEWSTTASRSRPAGDELHPARRSPGRANLLLGRAAPFPSPVRGILAKIRPEPAREPLPPPKVYAPRRAALARRRRGCH